MSKASARLCAGIDAHDQGAIAQARKLQAGGGGKTGFPDASFAAEEKDAHTSVYSLRDSTQVTSSGLPSRVTFTLTSSPGFLPRSA